MCRTPFEAPARIAYLVECCLDADPLQRPTIEYIISVIGAKKWGECWGVNLLSFFHRSDPGLVKFYLGNGLYGWRDQLLASNCHVRWGAIIEITRLLKQQFRSLILEFFSRVNIVIFDYSYKTPSALIGEWSSENAPALCQLLSQI